MEKPPHRPSRPNGVSSYSRVRTRGLGAAGINTPLPNRQQPLQFPERLWNHLVEHIPAHSNFAEQTGVGKQLKVVGDRGLGQCGAGDEVIDGEGGAAGGLDFGEELQADRVGEHLKYVSKSGGGGVVKRACAEGTALHPSIIY